MTTVPPSEQEIGPPELALFDAASAARELTTVVLANSSRVYRRGLCLLLVIDVLTALVLSATVLPLGPGRVVTPGAADMLVAVLWVTVLASSRAYDPRPVPFGLEGARNVAHAGLVMAAVGLVLTTIPGQEMPSGSILMLSATAAATAMGQRWLADRPPLSRGRARDIRVVIAGNRRDVDHVLAELRAAAAHRYQPVAICLLGASHSTTFELPVLRGLDNLATAVSRHRAAAVIVAPCRHLSPPRIRRLGWELESSGTQLFVAAGLLDVSRSRTSIGYAGSLPMLHIRPAELRGGRRLLKHAVERSLACLALVVLAPCLVTIAWVIRAGSPGPALYRQTRVGKDGVLFSIVKFRTMAMDADARRSSLVATTAEASVLFKLPEDPRVTREGRFLRRYSIDELPQLLNVVRGEMSLVGPRPPLPEEVAQYEPDAHRRLAVTPGMTGLWQVSGRSELTWEQSLRLDLRYVDNWSLGLDLRIVCRTAHAVLGHRGAY